MSNFKNLHIPGTPLVLWNIWDAGSARAVAGAGAPAVATGSVSVAGAMGYPDGQALPLDLLLTICTRIAASVEVPLSVDFESGYAEDPVELAENAARLTDTGAQGCNFEDGIPPEAGIRPLKAQMPRIKALRDGAPGLFLNARTDLFLQNPADAHAALLPEAVTRARAYADAGADGFFAPGLVAPALIEALCRDSPLPVNVMKTPSAPDIMALAKLGVARISYGPFPWREAMVDLAHRFQAQTGAVAGQDAKKA
ncbi:isocitrate lyase/PEP mutase family protein [Paracoccus sulfuroxidans]|uniref:2-methylisocitrate lyase-like PEP mutase family enzyme n=1 Tax=Paracoccus sulfuroxidans TaxID=384678 RepID=A0A562NG53_9RHOB|nr:isocitrate lyase/phosphoenolpyruvate mutase family protein [Paracoccus sulfuroxidans]TWI31074.1 2-methylisocitrate lyase-like PEP mutase family enzyme [Paracoccus sulfuroxidans]